MNPLTQVENAVTTSAQQVAAAPVRGVSMDLLLQHLIAAFVFSIVGIVVFGICLVLAEKLTPFSIVHEIAEEHNMAVSIVVAAIVLGVSIIIAAAIQG